MEKELKTTGDNFEAEMVNRIEDAANRPLTCSFCGKKQSEVKHLIAGPYPTCICGECISLSVDMLRERDPEFCCLFEDARIKDMLDAIEVFKGKLEQSEIGKKLLDGARNINGKDDC